MQIVYINSYFQIQCDTGMKTLREYINHKSLLGKIEVKFLELLVGKYSKSKWEKERFARPVVELGKLYILYRERVSSLARFSSFSFSLSLSLVVRSLYFPYLINKLY